MLTDIFAQRYVDKPIWTAYSELEQRLLNQAFGIVKDALPYYDYKGNKIESQIPKWKTLHDRLARELGVDELSKRYYSYTQRNTLGHDIPVSGWFSWDYVCGNFVNAAYGSHTDPDRFIKERISFVELALRLRGEEIALANEHLPQTMASARLRDRSARNRLQLPGSSADAVKTWNARINSEFDNQVNELNERFRRAKTPLTYHNGFVQLALDETIERVIAKPFWLLVADPIFKNVDIDMKEALDRRDSNDKDPAIFAAKALESAIKIVSDTKGWTRGNESGAAQYIDNLISKANGSYLATWEGEMLKDYFRKVRNSVIHGPGSEPMPELTLTQTDWAIETAMSWVRTLVRRM
ncbi:AbiJ-NTD4 domain-containing protein [Pseudomonas sp. SDO55104_S430]